MSQGNERKDFPWLKLNLGPALIPRNKSSLINQHSSIISSFHNLVRTGHAPHRAMMKKPPGFRILLKEPR